jgi:hypothetical protein
MKTLRTARIKFVVLPLIAIAVTGCATVTNPVPEGYSGPVVSLADSGVSESGSRGRIFAVTEIDSASIENSLRQTRIASHGQGFSLSLRQTTRVVPVRPAKLTLVGTHVTAAPIHEMAARIAGTFFSIDGTVDFKPVQGKAYEVTGELTKESTCVWVADVETKQPVTEKVCAK